MSATLESAPPTDAQLSDAVTHFLQTNDLKLITIRKVLAMLCDKFNCERDDLASRKKMVREIINNFLQTKYDPVPQEQAAADSAAAASASARGTKRKAAGTGAAASELKPRKLTGLEKAVVLAPPLAEFLGTPVIGRSHILKRVAAYAKEHSLQDPADMRVIKCDDKLKLALNVDEFTFFSLAKIVSGLVFKPDDYDESTQQMARECDQRLVEEKTQKREADAANGVQPKKGRAKKQKAAAAPADGKAPEKQRKPSGLMKPMALSEPLIAVCGEARLARPEVVKRIWAYIRANNLKDPQNGSNILCDEKLSAIFDGSPTVSMTTMNKFLTPHLTKIE